jgi:TonB family protein
MAGRTGQSGDPLIWLGVGGVLVMGLAWLAIEAPWAERAKTLDPLAARIVPEPDGSASAVTEAGGDTAAQVTEDPLKLAHLALDAGMLIEPAAYSAWTLFGDAARADPSNQEAHAGLEAVAAALLRRGEAALEQGRYDDAAAATAKILEQFEEHAGASDLAERIQIALTPPEPEPVAEPEPGLIALAPPPDPVPELHDAFMVAMSQNAVLTPAGASARDLVVEMLDRAPDHELTVAARDLLVTEMLDRSAQSIEALDTAAARTWIDAATPLAADTRRVEQAEKRLARHLTASRSEQLVPADQLTRTYYQPPEYPQAARSRDIEGWVEIGFVVTPSGATADVVVIDAAPADYFNEAAVTAVSAWRFEPIIYLDQAIAQKSLTRVAFVLD